MEPAIEQDKWGQANAKQLAVECSVHKTRRRYKEQEQGQTAGEPPGWRGLNPESAHS